MRPPHEAHAQLHFLLLRWKQFISSMIWHHVLKIKSYHMIPEKILFRLKDMAKYDYQELLVPCYRWYECSTSRKCSLVWEIWWTIWVLASLWKLLKQQGMCFFLKLQLFVLNRGQKYFSKVADKHYILHPIASEMFVTLIMKWDVCRRVHPISIEWQESIWYKRKLCFIFQNTLWIIIMTRCSRLFSVVL